MAPAADASVAKPPTIDELNTILKGYTWKWPHSEDIHTGTGLPFSTIGLGLPIVQILFPQPLITCLVPTIKWRRPELPTEFRQAETRVDTAVQGGGDAEVVVDFVTSNDMLAAGDDGDVAYFAPGEEWGRPFGSIKRFIHANLASTFNADEMQSVVRLAKFKSYCSTLCARGRPVSRSDRCLNASCGRVLDIAMAPISMECYELVRVTFRTEPGKSASSDGKTSGEETLEMLPQRVRQETLEGYVCDEFCADAYFKAKLDRAMQEKALAKQQQRRSVAAPASSASSARAPNKAGEEEKKQTTAPDPPSSPTSSVYSPDGHKKRRITAPPSASPLV